VPKKVQDVMSESHVHDDELLLFADGELSSRRAASVKRHLQDCWSCRVRGEELARAISHFIEMHRTTSNAEFPDTHGPEVRLRARLLQEAAGMSGGSVRRFRTNLRLPVLAGSVCAVLIFCIAVAGLFRLQASRSPKAWLPDSRLTPGATRSASIDQVCTAPAEENEQIPADLAARVFQNYEIDRPRPGTYEVDYLITPALGGARDVRNLWPQRYGEGLWNSRVKDALEDRLRSLVCSGKVDLSTAQNEIASDWIAAYRKYFHTERPLAAHALFIKDRPWSNP
jgi:hypothetical protein